MITDIFKSYIQSYKDLPCNLYHIQWKFRDEIRPRFGVMRGREFLMKDAYSFDLLPDDARYSYQKYFLSYLRTFKRLGVKAIPMKADTGPIGGDLSHEFIILADTGESGVFVDKQWMEKDFAGQSVNYSDREALNDYFENVTNIYAATDEKHDVQNSPLLPEDLIEARGIEVGHIFYFGTKYSDAFDAQVNDKDGNLVSLEMGSYGIGVSRVMAAIIEASHDDDGIVWPESVAPFDVAIINLKSGDKACDDFCNDLYQTLQSQEKDVLYDDRDMRAGNKFADMDLIGLPWQVIVGPRGVKEGKVEIKNRKTGEKTEILKDKIFDFIGKSY
jgi:prolyl-tRNA synthetase